MAVRVFCNWLYKNCILRKMILKFMNLIFEVLGKKLLILKHFMHRTISKRCVLRVFWTTKYVSEVYFTGRRCLLTLLTSFYGYNALGVFIFYSPSKTKRKKISIHQILHFEDMFLHGVSLNFCKKLRNVHFDLNSVFSLSCKIVLPTYGPFSWSTSYVLLLP